MSDITKFKVLMLGGKRCGKTSVLASLVDSIKRIPELKDISFDGSAETTSRLSEKIDKLQIELFQGGSEDPFIVQEYHTDYEISTFDFQMGLIGRNRKMPIQFIDIPGEHIKNNPEEVEELLTESNIILVAIDSVQLIEEGGIFSNSFNKTSIITNFFKTCGIDSNNQKYLILLVPLKCEKYYHENRMDEVTARIKSAYQDLITFLTHESMQTRVTLAITPILTVGDVVFHSYGRDEDGQVILNKTKGDISYLSPLYTYFRYIKIPASLSPRFCEQPMLYILKYMQILTGQPRPSSLFDIGTSAFFLYSPIAGAIYLIGKLFFKTREFRQAINAIVLKRDSDGYEVIQNPHNL